MNLNAFFQDANDMRLVLTDQDQIGLQHFGFEILVADANLDPRDYTPDMPGLFRHHFPLKDGETPDRRVVSINFYPDGYPEDPAAVGPRSCVPVDVFLPGDANAAKFWESLGAVRPNRGRSFHRTVSLGGTSPADGGQAELFPNQPGG